MRSNHRSGSLILLLALLFSFLHIPSAHSIPVSDMKRAELEFHVGAAFPLGSFGKPVFSSSEGVGTDRTLAYNGAKTGVNYGLAFNFYASPNWGVLLLFNGHSNKVQDGVFSSFQQDKFDWKTLQTDKWTEFMAMAGVTYRAQLIGGLVFTARAYLGYAHLISPFYSSEAWVGNSIYSFKLDSDSDPNFGYGCGVGFKYMFTRSFHIDLRCDYMGAVPFRFENVKSQATMRTGNLQDVVVSDCSYSFRENFQSLNLSLGFTVGF